MSPYTFTILLITVLYILATVALTYRWVKILRKTREEYDKLRTIYHDYVKFNHSHNYAITKQYAMVDESGAIVSHIRVMRCRDCQDLKEVRIIRSDPLPSGELFIQPLEWSRTL